MFVLVNGKIYNSDDVPIMVLFTEGEISSFKSQPSNVDIHCSFPPEWGMDRGVKWMGSHRDRLVKAKKDDFDRAAKRREKLPLMTPRVISEDVFKELLENERKPKIEIEPRESSSSAGSPFKFPEGNNYDNK